LPPDGLHAARCDLCRLKTAPRPCLSVTRMDGQALLLRFTRGSDVVPEGPTGFPCLDEIAAGAIRKKRGIIYAAKLLVWGVQRTRMVAQQATTAFRAE
jgi:hypothetical protein